MSYWAITNDDATLLSRWASLSGDNTTDSKGTRHLTWKQHNSTSDTSGVYSDGPAGKVTGRAFSLLAGNKRLEGTTNGLTPMQSPGSYSFWINMAATLNSFNVIAPEDPPASLTRFVQIITGRWSFSYRTSGQSVRRITSALGANSTWQHIAITWAGGSQRIFINGQPSVSATTPTLNTNGGNNTRLFIGGQGLSADCTALIADIRFYNRALSFSEVTQIFNGPEPLNTVAPVVSSPVPRMLLCTTGMWSNLSNGTLTYTYQWQQNTGTWVNVVGQTFQTYFPSENGLYRCIVTASNNGGSYLSATSNEYDARVIFPIIRRRPVVNIEGPIGVKISGQSRKVALK